MSEIKVNIAELDEAINKMRELKVKCCDEEVPQPPTVGGGKTVNEIEKLADNYKKANLHLEILISDTIEYLQMARDSYSFIDEKLFKGLKGIVSNLTDNF